MNLPPGAQEVTWIGVYADIMLCIIRANPAIMRPDCWKDFSDCTSGQDDGTRPATSDLDA